MSKTYPLNEDIKSREERLKSMTIRRLMHQKVLLLLAVLALVLQVNAQSDRKNREKAIYYPVSRVVDGDTFWVDDGSEKGKKVRLIGIDAPETRRTRMKEVGYYAEESRAYLSNMILGKRVRLEFDVDTFDQYRRTLAYVYLGDGTFINANMLKEGYAMVLTVPPNIKYAEEFVKLARKARERKRGLWKGTMLSGNEI